MILTRDKGSRMWGGGGTGGSGGGGGLDPSALAGYATMGFVEDNYVSKAFFNQLFEYQYNHRVLTKDGETVVSDVTTAMVAAPNEVVDLVSHTETDEETGYTIITTNTITGIKAKAGLWTNQYMSALGQNSSGGGGGGATLFEPLLSINESGLAAPTDAQDGMTVVWDKNTHKWKYGATGGGGITVDSALSLTSENPVQNKVITEDIKEASAQTCQDIVDELIGSGGGGGSLNQPLSAINSADLGTPSQSGVAIMWNGTAWVYQVPGGGTAQYTQKVFIAENGGVLTQAMVNTANTIYVIQHNYSLNNTEITIPNGCLLEFAGGKLSNGTLKGYIDIYADAYTKIFENISFGSIIKNSTLYAGWFTVNYSNDVTAFYQNILDYANNAVVLEKGVEAKTDGALTITKPTILDGNGSTIKNLYTSRPSQDSVVLISGTSGVRVFNLTVCANIEYVERTTGNVDTSTEYWQKRQAGMYNCYGIQIFGCHDIEISDCYATLTGLGILAIDSHDYIVRNCHIYHTLCDGIANYQGSYNGRISDNRIEDLGDDGISIVTYQNFSGTRGAVCHDFMIEKNYIVKTSSRGIGVIGCINAVVESNHVENCLLGCIKASTETANNGETTNIVISNNYVVNGEENAASASQKWGILAEKTQNVSVSNNHVVLKDALNYGIYVASSSSINVECNNIITGRLYCADTSDIYILKNTLKDNTVFIGSSGSETYPNKNYYIKENIFDNSFSNNTNYIKAWQITNVVFVDNILPEATGVISFTQSTGIRISGKDLAKVVEGEYKISVEGASVSDFSVPSYTMLKDGTFKYANDLAFLRLYAQNKLNVLQYTRAGSTAAQALGSVFLQGMHFLCTVDNRPLWWDGNTWRDANGKKQAITTSTTSNRPTNLDNSDIGFCYFDQTLMKPIWWTNDKSDGKSGWVDATRANV